MNQGVSREQYLSLSGNILAYVFFTTAAEAERAAAGLGNHWADAVRKHRNNFAIGIVVAVGHSVSHESAERWKMMCAKVRSPSNGSDAASKNRHCKLRSPIR